MVDSEGMSVNVRRSQVILRMPVDHVAAALILHDGERFDGILFISPSEDIARVLAAKEPFLPVVRNGRVCLIARTAIASIGVPASLVVPQDGDLPVEKQMSSVKLRSGVVLEGELRWTGGAGQSRTADYLNTEDVHFEVHTETTRYYVVKHHVALVEER